MSFVVTEAVRGVERGRKSWNGRVRRLVSAQSEGERSANLKLAR